MQYYWMNPLIGLRIQAMTALLSFERRSKEEKNVVVIFLFKFQLIAKKIFIIPALLLDKSMNWITHPGNDSAAFF